MPEVPITCRRSPETCWRCHCPLVALHPSMDGWSYYCTQCEKLTSRAQDLRRALQEQPPDSPAVGLVAGVSKKLKIEWGL